MAEPLTAVYLRCMGRIHFRGREGFTLMELLLVIAIIAILAAIVFLMIDPTEQYSRSRDADRVSDLKALDGAIEMALYTNPSSDGAENDKVYLSLPDTNGDISDDCKASGEYPFLPDLPSGWEYRCRAAENDLSNADGTGWIPFSLSGIEGATLKALPVDPVNDGSHYYAFAEGGDAEYSFFTPVESEKFASLMTEDGGVSADYYETTPLVFGIGAGISPTLSVLVSDPDGDPMDVTFYDAAGGTAIGTATSIPSGSLAATVWAGLERGTSHTWYATACDLGGCTTSGTWQFTTAN